MFSEDYSPPKKETLPTLPQYIKSQPKNTKVFQQLYSVEIIWTPAKFDNYTLQTHAFRLIIPKSHTLYGYLSEAQQSDEGFNTYGHFGIRVTDKESGKFRLESKRSKGQWEPLGQNGFKWPTDP